MSRGALASCASAGRPHRLGLHLNNSRVQAGHFQQGGYQPLDPLELNADVAGKFLPLFGGQILPAEQIGHHQHGGQRGLQLMGNVRQGIGQLQLFRLQPIVVFSQHDGHLVNFAFQNAQLALAIVPHVQRVLARCDAAQIVGQALHLPVPPEGVPQADAAE